MSAKVMSDFLFAINFYYDGVVGFKIKLILYLSGCIWGVPEFIKILKIIHLIKFLFIVFQHVVIFLCISYKKKHFKSVLLKVIHNLKLVLEFIPLSKVTQTDLTLTKVTLVRKLLVPNVGLEPTTLDTLVRCSTN